VTCLIEILEYTQLPTSTVIFINAKECQSLKHNFYLNVLYTLDEYAVRLMCASQRVTAFTRKLPRVTKRTTTGVETESKSTA
jgi:hypothetical protein